MKRKPAEVPDAERCTETIRKRDTYRSTGLGRNGWELCFTKERCSRRAVKDCKCRQHHRVLGLEILEKSWRTRFIMKYGVSPERYGK